MPDIVTSIIKLFAADTKIYTQCQMNENRTQFREDLDSVDRRSRIWQLRFNADKCKFMNAGNTNPQHE